jgi:WD40 repeat protein
VGEWEAGNSYPKAEHLQELIVLGVKQQAFTAGHEAEEIRALWQAARQRAGLDEYWLSTVLSRPRSSHLHVVPPPAEENISNISVMTRTVPKPLVDWGDALAVPCFYGREEELALLSQWVVQERCRVVSVLGMGGIGKSALSVSLMYHLAAGTVPCACPFEVVIFRSLRDAPSCEALLDDCLQVLSPQRLSIVPASLEQRISLLLSHLREMRVLMVLDNLECLLEAGDVKGYLRPGFEGYGRLLQRVAETGHQSCLLLTSREKPAELRLLEGRHTSARSLRLAGLDVAACKQLLEEKDVVGTSVEQESLIQVYGGNPLALKIVAETIVDIFGGEIGPFLAGETAVFGSITELLDEQFVRLSALEQSMLYWLTIVREPVTLDELQALLVTPLPQVQVLEAIEGLRRRSLIELGKRSGSFTLQSVVLEYATGCLITKASSEILQGRLDRLTQHGLEQAHAREYVRQTQERLLVSPLLADLQRAYWEQGQAQGTVPTTPVEAGQVQGTVPTTPVEVQLLSLLDQLRKETDSAQGYGPANLIALLRLQRGHLSGLDLSQLSIRSAYLQSIEMQDTSLAGSLMRDTVFAEAVSATWAVAVSLDGKLWAAGGMQGKVRVWNEKGQTLQRIWQAHTDMVQTLAFSPDGRTLVSGSLDGTVKLWDLDRDPPLWTSWQDCPQNLAFTPDASLLVSAGSDATVRLWDPRSGTNLQTLKHPGHVFAVAWSPDGSLLASSCFDGELRLWKRQKTESSTNVMILSLQTSWTVSPAASLAFAPDGRTLANASWDQTITLWEVPSGRLLHTLSGQTNQSSRVVWSPDGRTLASSSHDKAIWLWDVEQRRCRAALVGHTADINCMAFTPDSSHLLSGGGDSTLRVWDVESGQCVRVIVGYGVSLYDLDWSPNGTHLLSGGTDALVTLWDLSGGTPPRVLCGHHLVVSGVGWSPDGKSLASCGWDAVMRVWDSTSLAYSQKFEDTSAILLGVAWSPDGSLLAGGTYLKGMQVWDVRAGRLCWVGQPHLISFYRVAWNPDGTRLASGGDDGIVYVWDVKDGTLLQRLTGHHGRIMSVAWRPDGTQLASGSGGGGNGELFLWDVQSGECIQTLAGHAGMVSALAWCHSRTGARHSPYDPGGDRTGARHGPYDLGGDRTGARHGPYDLGGDRLVSGDGDGMLRWWDIKTGECVCIRAAHQGTIQSLRVSPDGRQLASCGDDGAVMIWDLCSAEHMRTLRRDRPYERLKITGIRGLTGAQRATLQALGAIDEAAP